MSRLAVWRRDPLRWGGFSAVVLGLAILWLFVSRVPASATTGGEIPAPREGFLAPDFTLHTLTGETLTLSDLRGRPVVVNLWASWCPPCRAEMPHLQSAFEAEGDSGLVIVAVNTTDQDREADAAAFADEFGLEFPIVLDREGTVSRQYLLRALPSTFFVGPDGVIQKVIIGGPMSEATVRTAVGEIAP